MSKGTESKSKTATASNPRKRRALSHEQFFQVCSYIQKQEEGMKQLSIDAIARYATDYLGFAVTVGAVKRAGSALGYSWITDDGRKGQSEVTAKDFKILAAAVAEFYPNHGNHSIELLDLLERLGIRSPE